MPFDPLMQVDQQAQQIDQIREFVIAGHGNLQKVKDMLATNPRLLNLPYRWSENDSESAIQAAAQVGSSSVAQYLLERGAPLEICTAAMLGRQADVLRRLDADPRESNAVGAHGIPLLPHAVWSGSLELVRLVYARGATAGSNLALHNAVVTGNHEIVQWLLANSEPDLSSKNFQGKTALEVAQDRRDDRMVYILKSKAMMDRT